MAETDILFLIGDDASTRKQARQHASRVVRKREQLSRKEPLFIFQGNAAARKQSAVQRPTKTSGLSNGSSFDGQRSERVEDEQAESKPRRAKSAPKSVGLKKFEKICNSPAASSGTEAGSLVRCPSPSEAYFSAARTDPFGCLPIKLDSDASRALDHFNTSMPYLEFCVYEGAALIPSRHVAFQSASETPAALHAIVATGATHLASLYGLKTSSVASTHVLAAIKLLREGLVSVDQTNWHGFAQTISELAAGEDFRENLDSSRLHLSGLKELLSAFGGIEALSATPKIQLLTCYVLNGCGATYFPHIWVPKPVYGQLLDPASRQKLFRARRLPDISLSRLSDLFIHVKEYVSFMQRISGSADSCEDDGRSVDIICGNILRRHFAATPKLLTELSLSVLDEQHFGGLGPKGYHRISCLFLIVCRILQICDTVGVDSLKIYLRKLQSLEYPNLRLLQFLLLQDGTKVRMADTGTSWQAVRLMQVYKLLNLQWQRNTDRALVGFLTGQDTNMTDLDAVTSAVTGNKWQAGEIMNRAIESVVSVVDDYNESAATKLDSPASSRT